MNFRPVMKGEWDTSMFPNKSACTCMENVSARAYIYAHGLERTLPTVLPGVWPRFMLRIQRPDGSWEGMWGVCFTYGTWFGVEGLVEAGVAPSHPALLRACEFLISKQNSDGGFVWSWRRK